MIVIDAGPAKRRIHFTTHHALLLFCRINLCGESSAEPWDNEESIHEELFSIERLEQHAESLAAAQPVAVGPTRGRSLAARLKENESVLLDAYRAIAGAVGEGRAITPAAEWLLDNYHLVEEQIREIRDDLPPGYYRQLPKLTA